MVALACTEEVAGHGVVLNLIQGAGHTERTTRHDDGTYTCGVNPVGTHVCQLVTAIYVRQDMSARNAHLRIAAHGAGPVVPFACTVRVFTATAAKHIAIVGVAVAARSGTALRIVIVGINVVWLVRILVWPTGTFIVCIVVRWSDNIPY